MKLKLLVEVELYNGTEKADGIPVLIISTFDDVTFGLASAIAIW